MVMQLTREVKLGRKPDRDKDEEVARRLNEGMTLHEVADAMGVTWQMVKQRQQRIERGYWGDKIKIVKKEEDDAASD